MHNAQKYLYIHKIFVPYVHVNFILFIVEANMSIS